MIRIDRKVISAILKLTNNYSDEMTVDRDSSSILRIQNHHDVLARVPVNVSHEDLEESILRLLELDMLRKRAGWYGGFSFSMTSRLKHRHAFWFDSFTRKFWGGFFSGLISGILITVLGGLLLSYLQVRLGI